MPVIALCIFGLIFTACWTGAVPALVAAALASAEGVIFGFGLALRFVDYAITYEPEVFISQYREWKRDGRWDAMVAEINTKRATRGH
jgi:hypothetical protein